jgi:PAS domain S-box-containing protein
VPRAARPPDGTTAGPELAQALLREVSDCIVVVDMAGRIVDFNPAAEAAFGRRRAAVLGEDWAGLLIPGPLHKSCRDEMDRALGASGRDSAPSRRRINAVRADGTEFAVACTITPATMRGKPHCCVVMRDASGSGHADQDRRIQQDADLVAVLPAAVLVEDDDRRVVLANERFRKLFRLPPPPEQLTGVDAAALMHAMKRLTADPERFARRIGEIVAAGELVPDEEIEFADGQVYDRDHVPVEVGRERMGHLWIYWDVTKRRELERQRERALAAELTARRATEAARRQLAEQNSVLRALDQLRTEHIATLSHELRTPLTSIVSFAALLRDCEPPLPAEALEFVDIIERNSDRLLRLIADLLLLARLETGALPLSLAPVITRELIEETVRARSAAAASRGVILEISIDDSVQGPPLLVDRQRLLQVLDNFLSNAIKFTEPGGRVTVTASYSGSEWRIDVADSGIGIPPDEQGKLFVRFFRASNARITQVPGTGLGLSVVKAIVDLHGGRIEVQSSPGEGTTFTVFLRSVT